MKTILLKFAVPLQSYGTDSHFDNRKTDFYPSKSSVIGLISACLGYRRYQTEQIQALNALNFAVRVDQAGMLLRDFQTVKKLKNNGTVESAYVTNRYYLQDAVFVVGISHPDDQMMEQIYYAFNHPYFQPFLGRRSAPLNADFLLAIEEGDMIEVFKQLPWQAAVWYQKKVMKSKAKIRLDAYFDKSVVSDGEVGSIRNDYVESFDVNDRKFKQRVEVKINLEIKPTYVPKVPSTHDVFSWL